MQNRKLWWLIFGLFPFFCIAPFVFSGLNSPEPWIGPLPFTVAYLLAVVCYGCLALYTASRTVWVADEQKGAKS